MENTRKVVLLALMVSQAIVLSIVEAWIPVPVAIPGVKLGLANIITMIVIIFFGYKEALTIVTIRCILTSMYSGGIIFFLFSVTGGILSTLIMSFLYLRFSKVFSILGISIAGAVAHNIGQLAAASFIMKDLAVATYLPVLLISGIIMGCFIGLCTTYLSRSLVKTGILNK